MTNLSELCKPVAEIRKHYPLGIDAPASAFFQPLEGLSAVNFGDLLYSQEYVSALLAELEAKDKRIAELEAIRSAAEKLVRCKGRYHSEQNYRALAALFGVTTPDLPPVEGDSEAVIAELRAKLATPVRLPTAMLCPEEYIGSLLWSETEAHNKAISKCAEALRAAGFKVEGDE